MIFLIIVVVSEEIPMEYIFFTFTVNIFVSSVVQAGGRASGHMQDGFCSISQEIYDVSSPDLVHRSTIAR